MLHFGLTGTLFGKTLLAASQSPTGLSVAASMSGACGSWLSRSVSASRRPRALCSSWLFRWRPLSADNLTILAFVIIALGGLGDYAGVVVAALLLGLAQSVVGYYLGGDAENVLPYALLILIMVARPQGFRRSA